MVELEWVVLNRPFSRVNANYLNRIKLRKCALRFADTQNGRNFWRLIQWNFNPWTIFLTIQLRTNHYPLLIYLIGSVVLFKLNALEHHFIWKHKTWDNKRKMRKDACMKFSQNCLLGLNVIFKMHKDRFHFAIFWQNNRRYNIWFIVKSVNV